jgi:hypothetical protein
MDEPFTHDEIEKVIKEIHLDKAPGPNYFNGYFLKKMLGYYEE